MKTPESRFDGKKRESILERQKIIAPLNFVSVFHETKSEFLPAIDQDGLKADIEIKNIGKAEAMAKRNALIDQFRPEEIKSKGISRNNIYGYPFLEYGHGLIGADERFIKQDEQFLRDGFETLQKYNPNFLKGMGIGTPDEYVRKMTDPEYLKSQYPGEIIELKVDPQKCYVGDLEFITRIMDDVHRGWSENEAVQQQAERYWKNLITLEDFLKWYKKPEYAEDGNSIKNADNYRDGEPPSSIGFYPIKNAPNDFPWTISQPEILIPENVPQDHIKLVK